MKCRKFALSLLLALLVSSWERAEGPSSEVAPPTPICAPLPTDLLTMSEGLAADSATLKDRLFERKRQAEEQVKNWETIVSGLKLEIANDKRNSTELSAKLDKAEASLKESRQALAETTSLLVQSQSDLIGLSKDFDDYKAAAEARIRAQRGKAALWRGLALSAIGGLAGSLLDRSTPTGALVGAGLGAAGGVGWAAADLWPRKVLP